MLFHETGQESRDEATQNIDDESAHRKLPLSGMVQYQTAEFIPKHRAEESTQPHDQKLSHGKNPFF